MKKRLFIGVLATVLVFSTGTTSALAACHGRGHGHKSACTTSKKYTCNYVDDDEDGICDNCGLYVKNGVCGKNHGRYFVDADGDGICDNYGSKYCTHGTTKYKTGSHHH